MSLWSALILAAFVGSTLLLFVVAWRLDVERRRLRRIAREYCRLAGEYGMGAWEDWHG